MVDTGGSLSNTTSIPTPALLAFLHLRLKKGILRFRASFAPEDGHVTPCGQ